MLKVTFAFFVLWLILAATPVIVGVSTMKTEEINYERISSNYATGLTSMALAIISATCFVCSMLLFKHLHHNDKPIA